MTDIRFALLTLVFICYHILVNGSTADSNLKTRCVYAPDFNFEKRTEVEECCDYISRKYEIKWAIGTRYLTNFMENLKAWNCSQFYEECSNPTYDFTDFTKMVYTYFCDYDSFHTDCLIDIETALQVQINPEKNWTDTIKFMDTSVLSDEDIMNPCIQLSLYESDRLNERNNFSEIVHTAVPTCGWIWQGFESNIIQERNISPWTLAPVE